MKTRDLKIFPLRGMDERWKPAQVAAKRIRDMTWDPRDGWKNSGGYGPIIPDGEQAPAFAGYGHVESIHWFSQHNGSRQFLIWEHAGVFLMFNGSTRGWDTLMKSDGSAMDTRSVVTTPHMRTQSLAWNGLLYLVDGRNAPLVFNGRYVEPVGFSGLPPAPEGLTHADSVSDDDVGGIGLGSSTPALATTKAEWAYRYRVSFVNERGQESELSAPSQLISSENPAGGKRLFAALSVPIGDDRVVARRLYRTTNLVIYKQVAETEFAVSISEFANYYYLEELQDNVSDTFMDVRPDGTLGSLVDPTRLGSWPSAGYLIASYKGTVFLALPNSQVAFSEPNKPEVIPALNRIYVGPDDSGAITAMYETRNALVVFKQRGIFLIKGDPVNGFFVQVLTRDTGCVAPDSLIEVPSAGGLFFLGRQGVYLMRGTLENTGTPTGVVNVSQPIPDWMERVNWAAAVQSFGVYSQRDHEFWLAAPFDGSDKCNKVLVFHDDSGSWSYREDMPISCMTKSADHRQRIFFGSNNTVDHPGIFVYSLGWPDKDGDAIKPLYETTDIDFGSVFSGVSLKYISVYAVAYGNNDIRIAYYQNRDIDPVRSLATTVDRRDSQDITEVWDVYGTATWGGGKWYTHRPTVIRYSVTTMDRPKIKEIRVAVDAADGGRIQVLGIELSVSSGPPTGTKTVDSALGQEIT